MKISVVEVVFVASVVVVWCGGLVASRQCLCEEATGVADNRAAILGFIAGPEQGHVRVPLAIGYEHQRSKKRFLANTNRNSNGGWTKVLQDLYESRSITTTIASVTTTPKEKAETDNTQSIKWREIVLPEAVAFSKSLVTYFTEEEQLRAEQDLNRTARIFENSSGEDALPTTVKQARYFSYSGSSCAFEYVLLTRPVETESSSFELVIFGPGDDFGRRG
ncbi:uncharacterized protein LOC125046465 [Penaeus chinensis]|uniref:uncharacterized protein LOC125046465 n=1 Tax=Penaeus chinensis TaxID=139456 RepID=UPI001FB6AAC1|nr:uncharacterized protein LOC125046465 [Penaeus chinensis]